jgi:hypothetical protein
VENGQEAMSRTKVTMQDIVNGTPAGQEAVQRALEASVIDQEAVSAKARSQNSREELDQESEQALLLEEAYQLGYHKVKNGCLQEPLKKLNALISKETLKARIDELSMAYDNNQLNTNARIVELQNELNQPKEQE